MKKHTSTAALLHLYQKSIFDDVIKTSMLDRAKAGNPVEFTNTIDMSLELHVTPVTIGELNATETEAFFNDMMDFFLTYLKKGGLEAITMDIAMEGFGDFLTNQCSVENEFASEEHIIWALFNKRNHTGREIKSEDIIKMVDSELVERIIRETFKYEDGKVINSSVLPMAWDDSRGMVMIDLAYVCGSNQDDIEEISKEDLNDILEQVPNTEHYEKDGKHYIVWQRAADQQLFTPIVINHAKKEVYFSLQGDTKKIMNPDTYEGWMSDYDEMMSDID